MSQWKRFNGDKIENYKEVLEDIIQKEQKDHELKICVGSDSQEYTDKVEYATVILIVKKGSGAQMLIKNSRDVNQDMTIKHRMIEEVGKSVEVAYDICDILDKYDIEIEVHADINTDEKYRSSVALNHAMSYILGMGFAFKGKPEAYASSHCADRVCR